MVPKVDSQFTCLTATTFMSHAAETRTVEPARAAGSPFGTSTQALALLASVAICFSAAAIGSVATASAIDSWYAGLTKPDWNPPNWVFGPVWTTLYLMMAASAWLVWRQAGWRASKLPLSIFGVQLLLNTCWSLLFFGWQQPGWAFLEIIVLWLAIAVCGMVFCRRSALAAWLLAPYLAWVTFAAVLNFAIWQMN